MKPQDGNEYLRTYITLKNTSNQSFDYNAGKFQVQDSSGVQHRGRTLSELPYRIEFGELAPGGTVEGNLIFEIPEGDSGITLIYEPFEEDVGTVIVSL